MAKKIKIKKNKVIKKEEKTEGLCTVSKCEDKSFARGYCSRHYQRIYRNGKLFEDKDILNKIKRGEIDKVNIDKHSKKCSMKGCSKKVHARGYCTTHYGKVYCSGADFQVPRYCAYQKSPEKIRERGFMALRTLFKEKFHWRCAYENASSIESRIRMKEEIANSDKRIDEMKEKILKTKGDEKEFLRINKKYDKKVKEWIKEKEELKKQLEFENDLY